ncbi:MAG TPA: T9SS type A sorting domain-containing protein [Puia sp.]|jgi:hypothetical protein|nr:T9SS type A sorting domain-containing protein [Puia sp.]
MKATFTLNIIVSSLLGIMNRTGLKLFTLVILLVSGSSLALAQHNVLSVGGIKALTIKGGTVFSADSLVLIPTGAFTMASNAILETPVASPGFPNGTIKRVYYLNNPVTFTGTIQIYYQLSELNGNTESQLNYSDSTTGSWWLVTWTGFVNTASHFVQYPASSHTFVAATAASAGAILLLKLLSFSGKWDGDHVGLTWLVDQNEEIRDFSVQSSLDEQNWKTVNDVPGTLVAGQYRYSSNDYDAAFTERLYRLKMTELSGQTSYSQIVKISKANVAASMYVAGKYNGATIYFIGLQPKAVRVFNSAGQIVWTSNTGQNQYELNSLYPGTYFVQYELNGVVGAKQFVVW